MVIKMKKMNWRKIVCTVLMGAFVLQAAGCGGSGAENTTSKKEYVYVPEYQKLNIGDGVDQVFVKGDMLYGKTGAYDEETESYKEYLVTLKIGEDTPEMIPLDFGENSSLQRIGMDGEGNLYAILSTFVYEDAAGEADAETADGDAAEGEAGAEAADGEETEGEAGAETADGEDAEGEAGAETADDEETEGEAGAETADGEDTEGEADTETADSVEADGETGAEAATGIEAGKDTGDDSTKKSYEVVEEGGSRSYAVTSTRSSSSFAVGEEWSEPSSQIMELCRMGEDGSIISRVDITDGLGAEVNMYVQGMEIDLEGNVYLCFDQNITVLDKDGKQICKLEVENWINNIFSAKNGTVFAVYYGEEGMEAHPVDIKAKKMGDAEKNLMVGRGGNYTFAPGLDTDIAFCADSDLYTYSIGDEAPKKILNWIECDIDRDDVRSFTLLEDGRILVFMSGWDEESGMSTTELVYLTKKKGSEVPEQKILTYGTLYLDYYVRKQIIEFNRTNQEYRIEVKEYVTEDGMEGYGSGQEKMNSDIVSGKGPDIIELSGANLRMYAAKGILEDLYPYIDGDEEINREDYLPNVLKAFEVDGKLYTLPSRFYINTVLAKESKVGDRRSITLSEVMELAKELPEGAQIYEYATKSSILMNNIMMNMDEYVNWSTGECKFGSDEFIKALEFANQFDTEFDYNPEEISRPEKIKQDLLLMAQTSISSMQEYILYEAMFGEPMAFIGYPTTKENGSFISHDGSIMAINAKSQYKDGAWKFIRQQLTKEAQESNTDRGGFGFPVMKSALDKQFEEDMTEDYYEDENGNKVRSEKTTWGYDNFSVKIFAAKDYEVEAVRSLIESTDTMYQYDEKMIGIITEEANAFFEGQKSAKEVADIIQNRIQVYVNENR